MNIDTALKVPAEAPTGFVMPRWTKLVFASEGIDRRYYELCALSELKNALRSDDIWVQVRANSRTSRTISSRRRHLPT